MRTLNEQYAPGKDVVHIEDRLARLERMTAHLFRALHEAQASNKAKQADLNRRIDAARRLALDIAERPLSSPESAAEPTEAPTDHPNPETGTEGVFVYEGDRWTVRNGRAVVIGSNDWPPPNPGTHESDLFGAPTPIGPPPGQGWAESEREFFTAQYWSKEHPR